MTRKYDPIATDTGCKYADEVLGHKSSCLNCPFSKGCILDEPHVVKVRMLKAKEDKEILNFINQGINPKEVAKRFSVEVRAVQRAIIRRATLRHITSGCITLRQFKTQKRGGNNPDPQ